MINNRDRWVKSLNENVSLDVMLQFKFQATLAAIRSQLEEWKAKARDLQSELEDMRTKFHDLQASPSFAPLVADLKW